MNRIDRLLATVVLLQSRRLVRAEDIAANFEISVRTFYRDIAEKRFWSPSISMRSDLYCCS